MPITKKSTYTTACKQRKIDQHRPSVITGGAWYAVRSGIMALLMHIGDVWHTAQAQKQCGYAQLMSERHKVYPEGQARFEQWLQSRITRKISPLHKTEETLHTLPVVVHVIHKGEPVGVGSNLSAERIREQIAILNEDFRRQNTDAHHTPAVFSAVAADCKIAFVLAKRDPYGLPTSGITRTEQSINRPMNTKEALANAISWPPEGYLNFWIIPPDTGGMFNGLLGASQFPLSERAVFSLAVSAYPFDGIAVKSHRIGRQRNSYGRTATHEVGHFLGLRHVWGDGGCERDDFCSDTPRADMHAEDCNPKHSCGNRDMIENYMDYTPDQCMNIFTDCQKIRMRTVLEHDPIRRKLLSSLGGESLRITQNDAGIRRIISPQTYACENRIRPQVEVANYGANTLRDVVVVMRLNGRAEDRKTLSGPLPSYKFVALSFGEYQLDDLAAGYHTFSFEITSIAGMPDEHTTNNRQAVTLARHDDPLIDHTEHFENTASRWLTTPGSREGVEIVDSEQQPGEKMLRFSFPVRGGAYGQEYGIRSPLIDMQHYRNTVLTLQFRYSYAGHQTSDDLVTGLRIMVHEGCDVPRQRHEIFNRYGGTLPTSGTGIRGSTPAQSSWKEVEVPLTAFQEKRYIQVELLARDGQKNALYIDDITLYRKQAHRYDIGIESMHASYVACGSQTRYHIILRNYGTEAQRVRPLLRVEVRGQGRLPGAEEIVISSVHEWHNATTWVSFSTASGLPSGEYTLRAAIIGTADLMDEYSHNDAATSTFYLHQKRDRAPSLESFEKNQGKNAQWHMPSNEHGDAWEVVSHPHAQTQHAAHVEAYNTRAADYWMMSPIYDFSALSAATLSFEVAYAKRGTLYDALHLVASKNCGETFEHLLYNKGGEELSIKNTFRQWAPESPDDWRREEVSLSALVGEARVQLAFVVHTSGGNDVYVDNIELFNRSTTQKIASRAEQVRLYPNPASDVVYLSFHLPQRSHITLRLYDLLGQHVKTQEHPHTLNQIHELLLPPQRQLYILQVLRNEHTLRSFRVLAE